jgi:biotin-dependent carboxylase-like uncharacterized protein
MTGRLEVVRAGPLTTAQDAGRPGLAHLGVSPSGYADAPAARLANRLVGNPEDAAVLETTAAGPTLRLPDGSPAVVVAVTGAAAPVTVDGRAVDAHAAVVLQGGQTLHIGTVTAGLRTYVAVQGGLTVPPVLGSRSTDLLSGLGPAPLAAGRMLPYGPPRGPVPAPDAVPVAGVDPAPVLTVVPGPRDDWFTADALAALLAATWTVTPDSSRVGLRLSGPHLERAVAGELPPEGMVTGALQVPPSGQPVLLLQDHPTTGGYPVIACVREADLPHAAQAAPGTTLRFRLPTRYAHDPVR